MNLELMNVRQRYQQWTLAQLTELVEKTFEQREDSVDPAWRTWLINYCLDELRPHTLDATVKDWSRWLAFVLRYIQPLMMGLPPMETKPMIEVIRRRSEIIRALMFGTHEAVLLGLQIAYEIHADYRLRLPPLQLRPEQQQLFEKVMEEVKGADTRTLTGWSRYFLDTKHDILTRQIYEALHGQPQPRSANIVQIVTEARRQQTISGRKFEAYLSRALHSENGTQFVGQTLGYLNEFERRSRLTANYSKMFLWTSITFLVLFVLGALAGKLSTGLVSIIAAALLVSLGLLDVLILIAVLAVTLAYLVENYSWSTAALQTLEMLLGSIELQVGDSTSEAATENTEMWTESDI